MGNTPMAAGPADLFARIDNQGLEPDPGDGIMITTLDSVINWGRKNSIWPMSFGLACCAIEMMSMSASRFDIARLGPKYSADRLGSRTS